MSDKRNNQGQNTGGGNGTGPGTGVVTKTRPKTKKPSLYKVLLLNDDYTPMEFVVQILEKIFGKNREEAVQIMLHVHRHGVGICGVFTFEV
ncbi:MAG: ATP-dependent Clp protease adaptor ClpS, partial [Alphaproteobacteria bacterium]|nr:ATP-dependent Clp protease adaptor ClpS [Alphaproteobacteria bacterium]